MPAARITRPTEAVEVNGLFYEHGFNEAFEFYYHTDANRWLWQVWRRLYEADSEEWVATVSEPGRDGATVSLTARTNLGRDVVRCEPLAHLDAKQPLVLLCGMSEMIKAGAWPTHEKEAFEPVEQTVAGDGEIIDLDKTF